MPAPRWTKRVFDNAPQSVTLKDAVHSLSDGETEEEEDHDHMFAFDKDEVFDSAGSDSASNSDTFDDHDGTPTLQPSRRPARGPSKLKYSSRASSRSTGSANQTHDGNSETPNGVEAVGEGMQELRLSFAEPADISQVVDIHNFDVNEEECSTGVAAPIPKKVGLADFEFVSVVGQGAYGKVFLVRKKKVSPNVKSELYAMKVLKKASIVLHGKDAEHTRNERSILEDVRHPFIVTLHYAFQTASKLYLILGYASGGELFTYLSKERMFAEDVACFYVAELLLALEHLHDLGIIYRDLKPENVLLNANGHVLLTDFGLSKVALDAQTVCGTIEFMAPEVLDDHRKGGYEKAVDYWSLGVMLFDMLTGSPPFTGHNRRKIMDGILKKKVVWPKYLTPQARDLCNKLLQKNPSKRLGGGMYGAAMVQKHPFFRKVDWQKLAALEVEPPLVPTLTNPEDISHFDECFTSMPIGDSPAELGIGQANPGAEADPFEHFVGFSYVAEHQYM